MSSRKKRTLTLQEATELAQRNGLVGPSYFELNDDDVAAIRNLYERTMWRQSRGSRDRGIGIIRAFYYALQRRRPKRTGLITNDQIQRAYTLQIEAEGAWIIAQRRDDRRAYEAAADIFELAAEAHEDVADTYNALKARRRAQSIRRTAELNYPPASRDAWMRRRNERGQSHTGRRKRTYQGRRHR